MREIKFKIYDKNDTNCIIGPFNWNKLPPFLFPENFTLLQYTGLKDKNGIEIYEGDIIKLFNGDLYTVKFIEENNETEMSGYFFSSFGSEVIGNIFENNELLEK